MFLKFLITTAQGREHAAYSPTFYHVILDEILARDPDCELEIAAVQILDAEELRRARLRQELVFSRFVEEAITKNWTVEQARKISFERLRTTIHKRTA